VTDDGHLAECRRRSELELNRPSRKQHRKGLYMIYQPLVPAHGMAIRRLGYNLVVVRLDRTPSMILDDAGRKKHLE